MKLLFILLLAVSGSLLVSCEKSKEAKSEYPNVYIDDCITKSFPHNDDVTVCFKNIITDSRCPYYAYCVWEGTAVASFLFTRGGEDHELTLSIKSNHNVTPYASDTTVSGYKVEFVDLKPYPQRNPPVPPGKPYAEISITKL